MSVRDENGSCAIDFSQLLRLHPRKITLLPVLSELIQKEVVDI